MTSRSTLTPRSESYWKKITSVSLLLWSGFFTPVILSFLHALAPASFNKYGKKVIRNPNRKSINVCLCNSPSCWSLKRVGRRRETGNLSIRKMIFFSFPLKTVYFFPPGSSLSSPDLSPSFPSLLSSPLSRNHPRPPRPPQSSLMLFFFLDYFARAGWLTNRPKGRWVYCAVFFSSLNDSSPRHQTLRNRLTWKKHQRPVFPFQRNQSAYIKLRVFFLLLCRNCHLLDGGTLRVWGRGGGLFFPFDRQLHSTYITR